MAKTRMINIEFEVSADMTPEQLHEALCRTIHEAHPRSNSFLTDNVVDIECGPEYGQLVGQAS